MAPSVCAVAATLLLVAPAQPPAPAVGSHVVVPTVYKDVPSGEYGSLARPAFALDAPVRTPLQEWQPEPGDVILSHADGLRIYAMYALAFTGPPAHVGLVVRMPDGRPGVVEAGREAKFTRSTLTPLAERLPQYPTEVWVRKRTAPLSHAQSAKLTAFAVDVDGDRYATLRAAGQSLALARTRGPLRTFYVGSPRGPGRTYFCGELVIEALADAGVVDAETARPSAVFPRDLFFDKATNPYLDRHPPLGGAGWEPPARWLPAQPGRPAPTFHGPTLPAVVAAAPTRSPDTLAGAPPYLSPAPAAVDAIVYITPPPASEKLPPPAPLRFGPTGAPPRLGPGPLNLPD